MVEIRAAKKEELESLHRLSEEYAGIEESLKEFKDRWSRFPDLFVVAERKEEVIGGSTGRMEKDGSVGLQSVVVKPEYKGNGTGSSVLNFFEQRAREKSKRVSVASAKEVEKFYRENGYQPKNILLKVKKERLPDGYRTDESIVNEIEADKETMYLYADFENYSKELRDELKDEFNAYQVNTIYEKKI